MYEAKCQYLLNKRENIDLKKLNAPKAFTEYSRDMQNVYKDIKEYNLKRQCNVLIVFDHIIADVLSNKKLNAIVTEFFIRGRKRNISLVFITQSYFAVPKNIKVNSMHYLIMEIPNK